MVGVPTVKGAFADFVSSLGSFICFIKSPLESDLEVLDFAAEMLETSPVSDQKEDGITQKLQLFYKEQRFRFKVSAPLQVTQLRQQWRRTASASQPSPV